MKGTKRRHQYFRDHGQFINSFYGEITVAFNLVIIVKSLGTDVENTRRSKLDLEIS